MSDYQCQVSRKRKEPSPDGITSTEQSMPKRSTTEDPLRKVWTSLESFIARMEILERRMDNTPHEEDARSPHYHDHPRSLPENRMEVMERRMDNPPHEEDARSPHHHDDPRSLPDNHYPCSSSPEISSKLSEKNYMSLVKTIEAACRRLSVLEAKMNISYDGAFKTKIDEKICFVKGCYKSMAKRYHVLRHMRLHDDDPIHDVAALILQQKRCLQCDMDFWCPKALETHECKIHKEEYKSRMEIFKNLFERCSGSAYIVRDPSTLTEWLYPQSMGYKDIDGSELALTIARGCKNVTLPSIESESESNGLSHKFSSQAADEAPTPSQLDDYSRPQDISNVPELQWDSQAQRTGPFLQLPSDGLSYMLSSQAEDEAPIPSQLDNYSLPQDISNVPELQWDSQAQRTEPFLHLPSDRSDGLSQSKILQQQIPTISTDSVLAESGGIPQDLSNLPELHWDPHAQRTEPFLHLPYGRSTLNGLCQSNVSHQQVATGSPGSMQPEYTGIPADFSNIPEVHLDPHAQLPEQIFQQSSGLSQNNMLRQQIVNNSIGPVQLSASASLPQHLSNIPELHWDPHTQRTEPFLHLSSDIGNDPGNDLGTTWRFGGECNH